jgi:hypothetical protein
MVVVNQAGEIVLLNVRAEKQFGYTKTWWCRSPSRLESTSPDSDHSSDCLERSAHE